MHASNSSSVLNNGGRVTLIVMKKRPLIVRIYTVNKNKGRNDVTTRIAAEAAAIALFLFLCSDDNLGKRDYNSDKQYVSSSLISLLLCRAVILPSKGPVEQSGVWYNRIRVTHPPTRR